MVKKKILILGGGIAGCTVAFLSKKKNYEVELIERSKCLGGLVRTRYYGGHPYEFGPHVFFWPREDVIELMLELCDNQFIPIKRRLVSYIEKDKKFYRYPIHYDDIKEMPDKDQIYQELRNRPEKWPTIGKCSFEEYFVTAVGKTLYTKFMEQYTWKMWGIPGDKLATSMVWADRVGSDEKYDPIKYEDHTLGEGNFQIYPKYGWNPIFKKASRGIKIIQDTVNKIEKDQNGYYVATEKNKYYCEEYCAVINTLDIDRLFGEDTLSYMGRVIIPIIIPNVEYAYGGVESIYYPGAELVTRTTEMKQITKHKSKDTLILIEVPVRQGATKIFPENIINDDHYSERAYPLQNKLALEKYESYKSASKIINNLFHVGRNAQFKYFGMAETMHSALKLVQDNF